MSPRWERSSETTSRLASPRSMLSTPGRQDASPTLLTGDPHLAEDLAQEAFVRLMGRLSSIRDEGAIASYLRRSIVNLAQKHWRKLGNERRYLNAERVSVVVRSVSLPDVESS